MIAVEQIVGFSLLHNDSQMYVLAFSWMMQNCICPTSSFRRGFPSRLKSEFRVATQGVAVEVSDTTMLIQGFVACPQKSDLAFCLNT
jgi:hypothetical protein